MAFNGSGTFVRLSNWVADAALGTKIRADKMDAEMDGFATGLTNTITRDGQSTTTARIPFGAGIQLSVGTVGAPSINFAADSDTGTYSPGSDQWAVTTAGTQRFLVNAGAISVTGTFAVSGAATLSSTLTVTGNIIGGGTLSITGGQAGFAGGSVGAPGIAFASDLDNGAYLIGTNNWGLTAGGTKIVDLATTGAAITGTFSASGAATLSSTLGVTGNFAIATNKFNVTAASGNTTIAGTLGVTGAVTLSSTLAAGATTVTGTMNATTVQQGGAALLPPGVIAPYAGGLAPTGWIECDGGQASRSVFAALFAVIGTTYGVGDGSTTFNVPNLTGRTIFGLESAATRITAASGITSTSVGSVGGADTTSIGQTNLPSGVNLSPNTASQTLTHLNGGQQQITVDTNDTATTINNGGGATGTFYASGVYANIPDHTVTFPTVALGGSGTALTNMPPCMIMRWIIKT